MTFDWRGPDGGGPTMAALDAASSSSLGVSVEIDRLFRDVRSACRQHDRDQSSESMSRAMLEFQAMMANERLQACRLRNAELQRRAQLLEQALSARRAQYAAKLQTDIAANLALDPDEDPRGSDLERKPALAAADIRAAPEAEQGPRDWRYYQARLPRLRKQPVRAQLSEALQGLLPENADQLFDHLPGNGTSGSSRAARPMPAGWRASLRSHLDGVRCVLLADDFANQMMGCETLVSCGEDAVLKAWDLSFLRDSEPHSKRWENPEDHATFRGHAGAALSMAYVPKKGHVFSGGRDGRIYLWHLPGLSEHDPLGPSPVPSVQGGTYTSPVAWKQRLAGHDDAVWSLSYQAESQVLASASADCTVRLWRPSSDSSERSSASGASASSRFVECKCIGFPRNQNPAGPDGVLAAVSVAFVNHVGGGRLLIGLPTACAILDTEVGGILHSTFDVCTMGALEASTGSRLMSLTAHPTTDLAAGCYSDGKLRLFSLRASRVLQAWPHPDAVSSASFNPSNEFEVATACHDGVVRVFDLRAQQCLRQEQVSTVRKYGESLHNVCHGGDKLIAAGADGNITILGTSD
eukprot:TRINITY_DN6571_c0_g2_i1.p1 TRINITY_DN6571_c0_g2~~TRINITY_DN6571_c0_g2_i1.p1  ORF type:complete len:580 (-),score=109.76 TRINITY_DN6571_c0_g2_i1:89-1828(-)